MEGENISVNTRERVSRKWLKRKLEIQARDRLSKALNLDPLGEGLNFILNVMGNPGGFKERNQVVESSTLVTLTSIWNTWGQNGNKGPVLQLGGHCGGLN